MNERTLKYSLKTELLEALARRRAKREELLFKRLTRGNGSNPVVLTVKNRAGALS
jgi:hypothetical protein